METGGPASTDVVGDTDEVFALARLLLDVVGTAPVMAVEDDEVALEGFATPVLLTSTVLVGEVFRVLWPVVERPVDVGV